MSLTLSLYDVAVPVMIRRLNVLSANLAKAEASAKARGFDVAVLLGARLAPDMHPLSRQIQIASDGAKGGAARLAGLTPPAYPDDETTLEQLQARIHKTVAYLESLDPKAFEGPVDRIISLKLGPQTYNFTAQSYLLDFVLPNLMFHVTTAYAILRHNGVDLGKREFLGGL